MKTHAFFLAVTAGFGVCVRAASTDTARAPMGGASFSKDTLEDPSGKFDTPNATALPATVSSGPEVSTETINQNISVTSRDKVDIVIDPPPLDLPFREVVGFARPGQTERVITSPMDYIPGNELLNLAIVSPRQALSPGALMIPAPPFVRMEVPLGMDASLWSFRVEDQGETQVFLKSGGEIPRDIISWDGFKEDRIAIKAGVVYIPILKVIDAKGRQQQFFGDPVKLDALRYQELGNEHIEFHNEWLFLERSPELAVTSSPLMKTLLNEIRSTPQSRLSVTVFEDENGPLLASKRLEHIKRFLADALVMGADEIEGASSPEGERGPITEFVLTRSTAPAVLP